MCHLTEKVKNCLRFSASERKLIQATYQFALIKVNWIAILWHLETFCVDKRLLGWTKLMGDLLSDIRGSMLLFHIQRHQWTLKGYFDSRSSPWKLLIKTFHGKSSINIENIYFCPRKTPVLEDSSNYKWLKLHWTFNAKWTMKRKKTWEQNACVC